MLTQFYNRATSIQAERISHYAVVLISIVAIAVLISQLRSIYRASSYQPEISVANRAAPPQTSYQASDITDNALFGAANIQSLDNVNLPTTLLQLQLRGAFTSTNPQLASAIIEGPDGQARSFRVGSRVYGNATLHTVYGDRIVLSRSGELETLYFPDPSQAPAANTGDTIASAVNAIPQDIKNLVQENMSVEEIQQAGKQLRSSAMTPEQRKALIRKRLLELRNRARQKQ